MAHTHPVVDSDARFVIDPNTRMISTTSDKLELVQGDHQSERITFEIPRIVEGHDMSLCDRIEIHYIDSGRGAQGTSRDIYLVDDFISGDRTCTFTWLVSGNATRFNGKLSFSIIFKCHDSDGACVYRWNTEICKLLSVKEGLDNTDSISADFESSGDEDILLALMDSGLLRAHSVNGQLITSSNKIICW